jgi:hypothetical protein
MAIQLSDNININAAKPDGARYFNRANRPYENVQQVLSELAQSVLHEGLTVNVMGVEYWFPDGINLVVKAVGSVGVIDVTYYELANMIDGGELTAGAQYRITDYATVHNMLDYANMNVLLDYDKPVPAPTNIVVLPDAVGSNPITYYCVAFGLFDEGTKIGGETYVSLFSEEFTYTEGGETTSTMISYDFSSIDNVDFSNIVILRGLESGVYTAELNGISAQDSLPYDMFNQFFTTDISYYYEYHGYPEDFINIGTTEELIVTANDNYNLDKFARSAEYPQDIIYYDWNPNNWLYDPAFSNYSDYRNGYAKNQNVVSGFKGVINFRHDTLNDNYMGYDFRNVKYRRWSTNTDSWVNNIPYGVGKYVIYNNILYKSKADNNLNFNPSSNVETKWLIVMPMNTHGFFVAEFDYINGNGEFSAGDKYIDVKTFDVDPTSGFNNTYEESCLSNHFQSYKDDSDNWYASGSLLTNNVFFLNSSTQIIMNTFGFGFYSNTVYSNFSNNNFDDFCSYNIFAYEFMSSKASSNFYGNIFKLSNYNTFGGDFGNNFIDEILYNNTFGSGNNNNIIGYGFTNNTTDSGFQNNIIGRDFGYNSIGVGFHGNNINNNFYSNTIKNNVANCVIGESMLNCEFDNNVSEIDLTTQPELASEIYDSNYNHRIFVGVNSTIFVEWIDEFYDKNISTISNISMN